MWSRIQPCMLWSQAVKISASYYWSEDLSQGMIVINLWNKICIIGLKRTFFFFFCVSYNKLDTLWSQNWNNCVTKKWCNLQTKLKCLSYHIHLSNLYSLSVVKNKIQILISNKLYTLFAKDKSVRGKTEKLLDIIAFSLNFTFGSCL